MKTVFYTRVLAMLLLLSDGLFNGVVSAQNLVPNPSFEEMLGCPGDYYTIDSVNAWRSCLGSADYLNSCSGPSDAGVPVNPLGYEVPVTGNAYCGIICLNGGSVREVLGCHLLSMLIPGQKYFVSFNVSLAEISGRGVNKLGAKFTTVNYYVLDDTTANPAPIDNNPQIFESSLLTDMEGWQTISGAFVADSAYSELMLGAFFDDDHIETSPVGNGDWYSYYYIDDVCVSTDSLECLGATNIHAATPISLTVRYEALQRRVYIASRNGAVHYSVTDALGRAAASGSFLDHGYLEVARLSPGLYVLSAQSGAESLTRKFIFLQ